MIGMMAIIITTGRMQTVTGTDILAGKRMRLLLGKRHALVAHFVGEDAQRAGQAGAEFLGLLQQRREGAHLVEAQPVGQRFQRIVEAAPCPQLQRNQLQVLAERRIGQR